MLEGSWWFPGRQSACLPPSHPLCLPLSPTLLLSVQSLRESWKARVGDSLDRAASALPFGKLKPRIVKLQGHRILCSFFTVVSPGHCTVSDTWRVSKEYFLKVHAPVHACTHLHTRAHTDTIQWSYRELHSLESFKENDKPLVQLAPFPKPGGREMIPKLSGVFSHSEYTCTHLTNPYKNKYAQRK